uniref:Respiratory burst oxidase C family protein n=1 Tax=Rhizophora mucronata TaxID=61149 RepID=A0A2P2MZ74_RHIMU
MSRRRFSPVKVARLRPPGERSQALYIMRNLPDFTRSIPYNTGSRSFLQAFGQRRHLGILFSAVGRLNAVDGHGVFTDI